MIAQPPGGPAGPPPMGPPDAGSMPPAGDPGSAPQGDPQQLMQELLPFIRSFFAGNPGGDTWTMTLLKVLGLDQPPAGAGGPPPPGAGGPPPGMGGGMMGGPMGG